MLYGWRASSHPFHFHAAWRETAQLPIDARIAQMARPEVKARLLAEQVPIADERTAFMLRSFNKMYPVHAVAPDYEPRWPKRAASAPSRWCTTG